MTVADSTAASEAGPAAPPAPAADPEVPRLWLASDSSDEQEAGEEPAPTEALMTELLGVIEEVGAVYLAVDGQRCEEWPAAIEGDRISLVRETHFPLVREVRGRAPRFRHRRSIRVSEAGLVLEHHSTWEWLDVRPPRGLGSVAGGLLCEGPRPTIARVRRGLHYEIGGADLYFTRRACERALSSKVLIARCGDRAPPTAVSPRRGP